MTQPTMPADSAATRTAKIIAAASLLRWAQSVRNASLADAARAMLDRIRREERA